MKTRTRNKVNFRAIAGQRVGKHVQNRESRLKMKTSLYVPYGYKNLSLTFHLICRVQKQEQSSQENCTGFFHNSSNVAHVYGNAYLMNNSHYQWLVSLQNFTVLSITLQLRTTDNLPDVRKRHRENVYFTECVHNCAFVHKSRMSHDSFKNQ